MKDIAVLVLAVGFAVQAAVAHFQQEAIESMILNQVTENYRTSVMSKQLARLQRELDKLKEERSLRLDKIALQADLNTAMLRVGPGGRRALLADRNVRFYLGQ